ncbi:addiction module protein [Sulfuricurvum sp.]|uniref:addiction module protein n=1 Tax=Sulfuricurvum sp. TaxID=2025608 RepID=UPI00263977CE|nr:addiction module protein [Sulfuricurvum sp.]MDD2782035.1 addiction module protein [Sulfuricurvum sp.]
MLAYHLELQDESVADKVMTFLNSLPKGEVTIEPARPWYADEVKRRIEEYRSRKMETTPWDEGWEEIEDFLNGLDERAS